MKTASFETQMCQVHYHCGVLQKFYDEVKIREKFFIETEYRSHLIQLSQIKSFHNDLLHFIETNGSSRILGAACTEKKNSEENIFNPILKLPVSINASFHSCAWSI